jgi:carbonic anhydrase
MPEFAELMQGYQRFRTSVYPSQRARFEELVERGQHPKLMIIGCSDSRVDPAQIFDVDPGEIFVVRNVAALVPPFEEAPGHHGVAAAVEFAVQMLEVKQIVVMGHGMCGGCKAALSQGFATSDHGEGALIHDWVHLLDDARAKVAAKHGTEGRDAERQMEWAAVQQSITNLRTFPWVVEKEKAGALKLRGAFFAITEGTLRVLDEDSGEFEPV